MPRFTRVQSCCTTGPSMCFWGAMFALFYGLALLATSVWPALEPYGDTIILAALGVACVINFARNRTLHCGLTGPLFIAAMVGAALIEAGVWDFNMAVLWGVVAIGLAIALAIEWRTFRESNAA